MSAITTIKEIARQLNISASSVSRALHAHPSIGLRTRMRVQQLAKELKVVNTYVRSCACPPMKIISNPHVSIAGRLPEEVYFRALIQYSHKSFHESFIVNELLLLRRKHQYDTCKPINVFALREDNTELYN